MDSLSSFLKDSIGSSGWTKDISNIWGLEDNLNSLKRKRDTLDDLHRDVKEKVESEERRQRQRTNQVSRWFRRVEDISRQVDGILAEGGKQEVRQRYLGCFSPKTCWVRYNLGKQVDKEQSALEELIEGGQSFNVVAYRPASAAMLDERPVDPTVGFESILEEIWDCVEDENIGVIGLHGMGGVGKTTLLKNINNKLCQIGHSYELAVWVVMSKQGDPRKIQQAIWRKLDLTDAEMEYLDADDAAAKILNVMKQKKILLLLDDVWEDINLLELGIPPCNHENESKIIFTTRFEDVCDRMKAKKISVECLPPDKALELFMEIIGTETRPPEVLELAKTVAQECSGLPLALKTVARAMMSKRSPQEWMLATEILQRTPANLSEMEKKVFIPLKFSYDNLPDETHKKCFLSCSLFPEDYHIHKPKPVDHWIGEGLPTLHEVNMRYNYGFIIIACLTRACLLEDVPFEDRSSFNPFSPYDVKMHDVVRDMAIWITSNDGVSPSKILVQDDLSLFEPLEFAKWDGLERIAVWHADKWIANCLGTLSCTNLLTLIISKTQLEKLPDGIFSCMPILRVLDLSWNCRLLELPRSIGLLKNLRYLNAEFTQIGILPDELKNLLQLQILQLQCQRDPNKVISSLSFLVKFSWGLTSIEAESTGVEDETSMLEQLQSAKALSKTFMLLTICFGINSQKLVSRYLELQPCLYTLTLLQCEDLISLGVSASSLRRLVCLRQIVVAECQNLVEIKIGGENELQITPAPSRPASQDRFCSLGIVIISGCKKLEEVTSLIYSAPNLESLYIMHCSSMVKLISGNIEEGDMNAIFSRLTILWLEKLPKLESICERALPFPLLGRLLVNSCASLKRLPLDSSSAKNSLKNIVGEKEWWDCLQWDAEATKEVFSPKYIPRVARQESTVHYRK